jgi:hypothetical protein
MQSGQILMNFFNKSRLKDIMKMKVGRYRAEKDRQEQRVNVRNGLVKDRNKNVLSLQFLDSTAIIMHSDKQHVMVD